MEKKDLSQELEKIKAELEELKKKIAEADGKGIMSLPEEAFSKVFETVQGIAKTAMEIVEKSFAVLKSAAAGAIEGAKKALKEGEGKE